MIDLHAHSTFSDGSYTPEDLARLAADAGLTALALTDHDCTDGNARLEAAAAACGLRGIGGVEISAEVERGTMHMLGYFVDPAAPELARVLSRIRGGREERNREILGRLQAQGLELTWAEVAAYAAEDVVGRPHFAQALIARGYVKDKDEAFSRYLARGRPGYADRFRLSPADSLAAIRAAGGVAVLAHPFTLDLDERALDEAVGLWKGQGLAGVEVFYSEHSPAQVERYGALARRHGLVATGGSDFHGALNPAIRLGVGFGSLKVPDGIVDELEARR